MQLGREGSEWYASAGNSVCIRQTAGDHNVGESLAATSVGGVLSASYSLLRNALALLTGSADLFASPATWRQSASISLHWLGVTAPLPSKASREGIDRKCVSHAATLAQSSLLKVMRKTVDVMGPHEMRIRAERGAE